MGRPFLAKPGPFLLALSALLSSGASLTRAEAAGSPIYTHVSWTSKQGLPAAPIRAIAQDREGFLWLGTEMGLVRFDGSRFEPLTQQQLPDRNIRALFGATDGSLWIGHAGPAGVSRLQAGHLESFSGRDGAPTELIWTILEDREGTIWVGDVLGLTRFRNDRWERLGSRHGLPPAVPVRRVFEDRLGTLWLATTAGVFRRYPDTDRFRRHDASPPDVRDLTEGRSGVWAIDFSRHGLRALTDRASSFASYPVPFRSIFLREELRFRALLRDRSGTIWLTSLAQGLVRMREQDDRLMLLDHVRAPNGLTSDRPYVLFEDREGNVWVGTQTGLDRFSASRVEMVTRKNGSEPPFTSTVAATPDGSVWISDGTGLLQLKNGRRKRFDQRHGVPARYVRVMHTDRHGTLWMVSGSPSGSPSGSSVTRYEDGRFEPVRLDQETRLNLTYAMTMDQDGDLWFADRNEGVLRWTGEQMIKFKFPEVAGKVASAAYTDQAGRVWLGFLSGGVVVYEDGALRVYDARNGLTGGTVVSVTEDQNGRVWICQVDGLSRLTANGTFETLTAATGLPGTALTGLAEDQDGYLWLGSSIGIIRLHPDEFTNKVADPTYEMRYAQYDENDGLSAAPVWTEFPSVVRASDGRIWFVCDSGLAVVNPGALEQDRQPVSVRITSVTADGQRLEPTQGLRLPPNTLRLEIEYAALNLSSPSKVRFRSMVEGFDRAWVQMDTGRAALYTNLSPRTYRFVVQARNPDRYSTSAPAAWTFSIQAPFYRTWWFTALCVAVVGCAFLLAWHVRLRIVRRQAALVLAERTHLAREIHDTLLQCVIGVDLQCAVMNTQLDPLQTKLKDQLSRVRAQIKQYVREARQTIWQLRADAQERPDVAMAVREFGETISEPAGARFEFRTIGTPRLCDPDVEQYLLRTAREAIRNAVDHAEANVIRTDICFHPESVCLRVSDDGCGFEPQDVDSRVNHLGLDNMRNRALQIGAELKITSGIGQGTQIEATVPTTSAAAATRARWEFWRPPVPRRQ